MFNENDIRDEIIESLSDSKVPNNPGKIKALYLDRVKERNKPWYKYRRIYAIGGPVFAATLAVAIVLPVTLSSTRKLTDNRAPAITYVTEYTKIEGSNNQIAFATSVLGNAANSLKDTDKLPCELLAGSSFTVIKDLYILNSYMYTAETLLNNEFNPNYSTSLDETDPDIVNLKIEDSDVTSSYTYTAKTAYEEEENYSLEGVINTGKEEYDIKGSKSGVFGYYSSNIAMYLDEEETYGFKIHFDQDLLGSQIIYVEEFRDARVLSATAIQLETRTSSKGDTNYYVRATIDNMDFVINNIGGDSLNINIYEGETQKDSFVVKVDEENNTYNYTNHELGLDFKLKRK